MYPAVIDVQPNEDFSLRVPFEDGSPALLDMKPYLGLGVFRRIEDPDEFRRVRIAFDTIEWPCGVDLDPEFVHAKACILTNA